MKLKDLVVVTGFPGIQRSVANRSNGLLVEDLDTGKVRFAPLRKHQFSPLETVSVYTEGEDDTTDLKGILQAMLDQVEGNPPPPVDSKSDVLREYFAAIVPNFDRERVHISDIKKIIRWFLFLNERGYLTMEEEEEEEAATEEEEEIAAAEEEGENSAAAAEEEEEEANAAAAEEEEAASEEEEEKSA